MAQDPNIRPFFDLFRQPDKLVDMPDTSGTNPTMAPRPLVIAKPVRFTDFPRLAPSAIVLAAPVSGPFRIR